MYKYFLLLLFIVSCERDNSLEKDSKNAYTIDYNTLKDQRDVSIDSLYQMVLQSKDDSVKVNELIDIFRLSIRNRPIRADILDEALAIAKSIDYKTGIANSLRRKGVNERYQDQYLKSLKFHKEALVYYKNSWDDRSKIKNLNSLGVTYRRLNLEEDAVKSHLKALDLAQKLNLVSSSAIALNGMGNAYITLKKYDEAIKYLKLALQYHKLDDNERGLGYDYSNLGEAFMYKQEYDSSFYYQNKALEIASRSKNKNDIAIIHSSMGLLYQHKEAWDKALAYYLKSIPVLEKNESKRLLSFSLINTGIVYNELDEVELAQEYMESGMQLASQISSKDNLVVGYEALSNLLESKGDYKEALKKYQSMVVYRDSIFDMQSENSTVAMNIKFDTDKKDEKIKRLYLESEINKNRSVILYLSLGLLLLVSIFSFVFHRMKIKNNNMMMDNMRGQIEGYLGQNSLLNGKDDKNNGFPVSEDLKKYGLSNREMEVLNYITQGLKNQEIADKMCVSLSTVKTHTQSIYFKLDVRNRMEAARKIQVI